MYAVVRLNTFEPNKLAGSADSLRQFDEAHAAQPGYVGNIVVDLQDGRRLVINLWGSEAHSAAALSALGPEAARVLNPLMSKPSELLAAGPVISIDLTPSDLSKLAGPSQGRGQPANRSRSRTTSC